MPTLPPRRAATMVSVQSICRRGFWSSLLPLLLGFALWAALAAPAMASPVERAYRCDGDPLAARYDNGAVDDPLVGNVLAGTFPGAFVVLRWRELTLQLPRTNDAGPPTYTDGKWLWGLNEPAEPTFLLRRGDLQVFACQALNDA
ncbi:hypothetical protein KQ313_12780 [Synechococcus sp. CS-1325]|uniref:hypothetical protein n=1 Tax=Synechococcus sp. CS-1325 TaxID=2847979 RepID=UPI00223B5F2B|nr:hypothetical protein [Synechococcus sp. CS-1325]MCT0200547.1 hypothetical protein [Synechococcus sp. CS-1325]